jgi:hypothetical protein
MLDIKFSHPDRVHASRSTASQLTAFKRPRRLPWELALSLALDLWFGRKGGAELHRAEIISPLARKEAGVMR